MTYVVIESFGRPNGTRLEAGDLLLDITEEEARKWVRRGHIKAVEVPKKTTKKKTVRKKEAAPVVVTPDEAGDED